MARRTVYSVTPVEDTHTGAAFFARKDDAIRQARAVAKEGREATVAKCVVTEAKRSTDLFVSLLNQEGWCASEEDILVIPGARVTLE